MTEYVLGFVFTPDRGVYLIHKQRGPFNVEGRWNGIGGKVRPDETPNEAMDREAEEEGGPGAAGLNWIGFGSMGSDGAFAPNRWKCWLYAALLLDPREGEPTTATDEEVRLFRRDEPLPDVVDNLKPLLAMAQYAIDNHCDSGAPAFVSIDFSDDR